MVDAKGNVLLGIMGNISYITNRRQQKPKQEFRESLPSAGNSANNAPSQAKNNGSGPKTTSSRGPLAPKFAGVSKLSGSSRRGVPRNAAGLRKWMAE